MKEYSRWLRAAVAVALLSSGLVPAGEAARRVDAFAPERVRVEGDPPERVHLSVSVLDREGGPVLGLISSDFRVTEAGIPQTLVDFGPESERRDRPLSAVLLVDRSGSVRHQMGKWREAGAALVAALRPMDEVRLSTFTSEISVVQDFTHDAGLIAATVGGLHDSGGGTRLFAAVDGTLTDLDRRPGRKVIFLLTDGLDNDHAGAWNMSGDAYLNDLVRRAVRSEVTVITILPGPTGRPFLAAQDLAIRTGGWWLYPGDDLPRLVASLGERLLASYYLAYDSTRAPGDGRRRAVSVTLAGAAPDGYAIRTMDAVYGETPMLDLLAGQLAAGDEKERARAASNLALVTDAREDAVATLIRLLKDDSAQVRAAAAGALGSLREPAAVKPLSRMLRDPDPGVRLAAVGALRELLDGEADPREKTRLLDTLESSGGD